MFSWCYIDVCVMLMYVLAFFSLFFFVFCPHKTPEEEERRRALAETELQRQKDQEEWDRAFEEELMQTGLPEDVVAACTYQILKVSRSH